MLGLMKSTAQYDASELRASMKVGVSLSGQQVALSGSDERTRNHNADYQPGNFSEES